MRSCLLLACLAVSAGVLACEPGADADGTSDAAVVGSTDAPAAESARDASADAPRRGDAASAPDVVGTEQADAHPDADAASAIDATAAASEAGSDAGCAAPAGVIVSPGGTVVRPAETVMRLTLVYQGTTLGVTSMNGVTMILPPSSGAIAPGVNAGYWFALESATQTLYTRVFTDPTVREGVTADGGFVAGRIPPCEAKTLYIDVPNDASATSLVVYGSPYGTDDPAVELARFALQ